MPRKKTITITEDNIPVIMEAVKNYGDLPAIRSKNVLTTLEILLHQSLDNHNNVANIKMISISKIIGISTSLVANKLKILIKYGFIENITPKGEVANVWKINTQKLQHAIRTSHTAKKLQDQI